MTKITDRVQCRISALRKMNIEVITMEPNKFIGYCRQDGSNIFENNLISYEGKECVAFYKELDLHND